MLLDHNSAHVLRNRRTASGIWNSSTKNNIDSCLALGFESWTSMLDQGFKSPDEYINFLEGNVSPPGPWQLCTIIAKKYGHRDPVAYCRGSYEHGEYKGFMPSPIVSQKSKEQLKKISDSLEKEMQRFQETGEVTLAFKDEILYIRVEELECKLNKFAVQEVVNGEMKAKNEALEKRVIDLELRANEHAVQIVINRDLKERLIEVEEFATRYKDNMLALENLLHTLIAQTNIEKADASTGPIDLEEKQEEIVDNDESCILYSFIIPFLILLAAVIYALYTDSMRHAELELLDNRPAFGNKLLM